MTSPPPVTPPLSIPPRRVAALQTIALAAIGITILLLLISARTAANGADTAIPVARQSLAGKRIFPPSDPWNQDISKEPVDPDSAALIASIGAKRGLHPDFGTIYNGAPSGIPYVVVSGQQPKVPVTFDYKDESDPGPYPIPPDAPIEGGPQSSNWFISGAPDPRWNDDELATLKRVRGSNFEVVKMGQVVTK